MENIFRGRIKRNSDWNAWISSTALRNFACSRVTREQTRIISLREATLCIGFDASILSRSINTRSGVRYRRCNEVLTISASILFEVGEQQIQTDPIWEIERATLNGRIVWETNIRIHLMRFYLVTDEISSIWKYSHELFINKNQ